MAVHYSTDGKPLWLIAVAQKQSAGVYAGPVSTVVGPPFNTVPWDLSKVAETEVGATTIAFIDGNHASSGYTVNGKAQMKIITRQVFEAPGTVCH